MCGYLETWHIDVEEFLDLRKNTGDDRRRTHDMNTANWVPDLFIERVEADGTWTLFSPDEAPDLHDLYGKAFAERYAHYEAKAQRGEMKISRTVRAQESLAQDADDALRDRASLDHLQRSVQPALTATARRCHPFVEPLHRDHAEHQQTRDRRLQPRLRQPREPCHSEPASIETRLKKTVKTAMRMLDNVIDINFYTVPEARYSNLRHRPVGLGIMGYQDALYTLSIPLPPKRLSISPTQHGTVSFHAISASVDLAAERGRVCHLRRLAVEQGNPSDRFPRAAAEESQARLNSIARPSSTGPVCERVYKQIGMRNSNTMAIAPTATISNICGVTQSIEPTYQNLFVKSNMSGDFTVVNASLVHDLKGAASGTR